MGIFDGSFSDLSEMVDLTPRWSSNDLENYVFDHRFGDSLYSDKRKSKWDIMKDVRRGTKLLRTIFWGYHICHSHLEIESSCCFLLGDN